MSKDKHKKHLNRREFLDRHKKKASISSNQEDLSQFSQRAIKGLQYLPEEVDLPKVFHQIDRRVDQKTGSRKSFSPFLMKIAAGLLILIIPAYFLFQPNPNPQQLFQQYFQAIPSAIPLSGADRGAATQQAPHFKALALYEEENYQEAIPYFENYLNNNESDHPIRFYYGVSLLANQKAEAAIHQLEQVFEKSSNQAYQRSAKWYQALGYILLNQKQQAKNILQELLKENGDYNQDANQLLEQLK